MSENLTTYIKEDPFNRLVVTATEVIGTGITRNETTLLYDDKGINGISGDFTHTGETTSNNVSGVSVIGSWALTNDVADFNTLLLTNKNFLIVQHNSGTAYFIREFLSGAVYSDFVTGLTAGQKYYWTMSRDTNIGAFGQLDYLLFSDINKTIPVASLSLLLHADLDYQYNFAEISFNDGNGSSGNLTMSNLDLGIVSGFQAAWARNSNQIIGVSQ
jgi:hypothetical protein